MRMSYKKGKDVKKKSAFGMLSVKAGIDKNDDVIDLSQKAKEKGGKLTMQDMMKLHGVK